MNAKLTILKLGGSVVTIKEKPFTPNKKAITRLAKEIKRAAVTPLTVIHGGGSFGHPLAKLYELKEGFTESSQLIGFSKTHQAMLFLNRLIMDSLIKCDIPAFAISPLSSVITKGGRVYRMEKGPLTGLLEMGFVPVLYGDVVFDLDLGFTVLSGDQLVSSLAVKLGADRIIMGMDVDGLYTTDPKIDPSARLIPHITLRELKTLEHKIGEAVVTDVTGGMLGKMRELMPAVAKGTKVIIMNAAKPDNLYRALRGEKVGATVIRKT